MLMSLTAQGVCCHKYNTSLQFTTHKHLRERERENKIHAIRVYKFSKKACMPWRHQGSGSVKIECIACMWQATIARLVEQHVKHYELTSKWLPPPSPPSPSLPCRLLLAVDVAVAVVVACLNFVCTMPLSICLHVRALWRYNYNMLRKLLLPGGAAQIFCTKCEHTNRFGK